MPFEGFEAILRSLRLDIRHYDALGRQVMNRGALALRAHAVPFTAFRGLVPAPPPPPWTGRFPPVALSHVPPPFSIGTPSEYLAASKIQCAFLARQLRRKRLRRRRAARALRAAEG